MKIVILDLLGVGIAGSSAFAADEPLQAARLWGRGDISGEAADAFLSKAFRFCCKPSGQGHWVRGEPVGP